MAGPDLPDPPDGVRHTFEEALALLAVFEDVREEVAAGMTMTLLLEVEDQIELLHHKLGLDDGGPP
jgi:hypothetical protein